MATILKRKAELMTAFEENAPSDRKRLRPVDDVDDMTWKWFRQARGHNVPVCGPMLQEKSWAFAATCGKDDFKASNGWWEKFKTRHNINQAAICGESETVDLAKVDEWKERLPSLLEGYAPKDIYNG